MLNLNRRLLESVLIQVPAQRQTPEVIEVKVIGVDAHGAKLGFAAHRDITIVRPEVSQPDRNGELVADEALKALFHRCWGRALGVMPYRKVEWLELQAALRNRGIDV